jgi:hypothetical protein
LHVLNDILRLLSRIGEVELLYVVKEGARCMLDYTAVFSIPQPLILTVPGAKVFAFFAFS